MTDVQLQSVLQALSDGLRDGCPRSVLFGGFSAKYCARCQTVGNSGNDAFGNVCPYRFVLTTATDSPLDLRLPRR